MANLIDSETSSFEGGTAGKWVLTTGQDPYHDLIVTNEQVHDGFFSLQVTMPNDENDLDYDSLYSFQMGIRTPEEPLTTAWDIDATFPIDPTKRYDFSVWMYIPSPTYTPISHIFGYEYFDADFVNQGGFVLVSEIEDWTGEWKQFLVSNHAPPLSAHYGALYVQGLSSVSDPPPYFDQVGRFFDEFIFEEHVAPTLPGTSVPSLRQRQNPLRVKAGGGGGGGGGL